MDEGIIDPLKMHCLIWFQYDYHLDHHIDNSPKLQAWGATKLQPYLAKHADSALNLTQSQPPEKSSPALNPSQIPGLKSPRSRINPRKQTILSYLVRRRL